MSRAFCACLGLILALTVAVATLAVAPNADAQTRRRQQHQQTQPEPPPQQPAPQPVPQPEPRPAPAPPPPPPVAQSRATEQSPVPVRVVETPKTAAQLAAEQQDREEMATFNSRLLIYAGLLVAVGFCLVLAFLVQTLYLWLALRGMRKSTTLTGRNMTTAQRAFIYVGSIEWSVSGANVIVGSVWANSGTTPTRSLRISTNWKASHGELPADFTYTYIRPPERLLIGPSGRSEVGSVVIPMRDIQAALDERVQLYFWGRATYEDIFEGTEPHFVEFCRRIEVKGTAPNALTLSFMHYGTHNRSDEDSQRPLGHDTKS